MPGGGAVNKSPSKAAAEKGHGEHGINMFRDNNCQLSCFFGKVLRQSASRAAAFQSPRHGLRFPDSHARGRPWILLASAVARTQTLMKPMRPSRALGAR